MANTPNRTIRLEVSEESVVVEIDGIRGEVTLGQAREVREMLAEYAVQCIQQTSRNRHAELQMLALDSGVGSCAGDSFPLRAMQRAERYRP